MDIENKLTQRARAIPKAQRASLLMEIREIELHKHLKELFGKMQPNYLVEVTHGTTEFGKDLVIYTDDKISRDVIGVVVKRGDISGKTSSHVDELVETVETLNKFRGGRALDEILSQIKQARAHPAELKTLFSELPVTKVLVVIAGRISNSVRTRVRRELSQIEEPKDIDWLVDTFTEHYPQVFFEGKTIDFLIKKIEELEVKHSVQTRFNVLNLSEHFTEPILGPLDIFNGRSEDLAASVAKVVTGRKIPFSSLADKMGTRNKLILFGDQGTGKSGSVAKYTIDELKRCADELSTSARSGTVNIPLLVHASQILNATSAEDVVIDFVKDADVVGTIVVRALLVDGLDEVPFAQREEVISKAELFSEALHCSLLITSRKVNLVEEPRKGYKEFELLPFEFGQAVKFLGKMLSNNQEALATLTDGLQKLTIHFPLIPLSLKMLVTLAEDAKEVPASITELYDRYFDLALGREDPEKGVEVLFDYLVKKRFLGALAYELFFDKDRVEVPSDEFSLFLDNYGSRFIQAWSPDRREQIVEELRRSSVLVVGDSIYFKHRTYLEYFVASHLDEFRDEIPDVVGLLTECHMGLEWDDVTFFYVGIQRRLSNSILKGIVNSPDKGIQSSLGKVLIGRLLQAGWHSPTEVKREGIKQAASFLPKVRTSFLELLEPYGDGRPVPRIFGDFAASWLADMAFGSAALKEEVVNVILETQSSETREGLLQSVALIHALRHLLSSDEQDKLVGQSVLLMESIKEKTKETPTSEEAFTPEEEMRILIALSRSDISSDQLKKTVKNKLKRVVRRAPEITRELLPFRQKSLKTHPGS